MSIFQEYAGRANYYTADEKDRLENPEKYDYDQAQYDAYAAAAQKRAEGRSTAEGYASDAIPYSYAGRGTSSTAPNISLAGYGGHTSGGTAGNVNLAGFAQGGMVPGIGGMFENMAHNYGVQGGIGSLPVMPR
tara:strand:- start:2664 stop:3062 length:399 start_codon:yes stop_codon:yes gene_type:complete